MKNLIVLFRFWLIKRRANQLHKVTGKRYYIIMVAGRFLCVDNSYIRAYNKKAKHKSQRINFTDLINMTEYMTSQKGLVR